VEGKLEAPKRPAWTVQDRKTRNSGREPLRKPRDAGKNSARSLVSRFFVIIPSTRRISSNCFRIFETPRSATNKVSQKVTTRKILFSSLPLGGGTIVVAGTAAGGGRDRSAIRDSADRAETSTALWLSTYFCGAATARMVVNQKRMTHYAGG